MVDLGLSEVEVLLPILPLLLQVRALVVVLVCS